MLIDPNNTRRFITFEGVDVLAIYDTCRSYTLYACVGLDEQGRLSFVSEPRTYWDDEVEEITP